MNEAERRAKAELKAFPYDERQCLLLTEAGKEKQAEEIRNRLKQIEETIQSLPQPYRCILYMRFLRQRKITEIEEKLHYSERQTFRKIEKAIEMYVKAAGKTP